MPRYAIKLAYDGSAFSGSQRQPDARTVEGEIARAAREVGILGGEEWFNIGSRTDAGVSALGNVGALDTGFDLESIMVALNSQTDDVWAYGISIVREGFNPRHARGRWYRYLMPSEGLDVTRSREVAALFAGEHDFTNFSKNDPTAERSPVRRLDSVEISEAGGLMALDVRGDSFLWQMVRRIAGAVRMAGTGEVTASQVGEALSVPGKYIGPAFPPLPPEGLVLMDVEYGIEFALEPLPERFQRACLQAKLKSGFYSELEKSLSKV